MNLEWHTAKVIGIQEVAPNTKQFLIEIPGMDRFDFIPGQFVVLDLPISEKKNKRLRSYSIASRPNGTNTFELLIELVEDGLGTHYIWQNIGIGSELTLRGPAGIFVLSEPITQDYFLICTGTGIAPFRSMITHLAHHAIPAREIYLIFGCRTQADLLYADELKAIERQLPNFHYIPTLSREQWNGRTGYVHAVYKELVAGKPDAEFMLCGWKKMIDETRHTLQDLGYPRKQIHFELYG